jgi:CRISPR-associated endonuclease Cas2
MNGSVFVISYDISDNRRRRLLSKKLEGSCRRVQKSVFETYATDGVINKIIANCAGFVYAEKGDSLRVYRLPGDYMGCFARMGGVVFDWKADIIL